MKKFPLVIGLAGGTGSGKTTIGKAILTAAGEQNALSLPQDAYYCAQHELPREVRALTNYDEPAAFDTDLLIEQLDALIAGQTIFRPVYDFSLDDRSEQSVLLEPRAIILLEGILVLHEASLRERMDVKIFVDAPADERFIRRLERDVRERGRSAESVINQYRRSVKPMHDLFVEPSKQYADLIVPEGGKNTIALEILSAYVRQVIADN